MSEIRTFFRHCPSCGRRFEIRLVKKEQVSSQGFRGEEPRFTGSRLGYTPIPTLVEKDVPSIVDVEEFRYEYKCKHCGVAWCELHQTTRSVDEPTG